MAIPGCIKRSVVAVAALLLFFTSCKDPAPPPVVTPRVFDGYHVLLDEIIKTPQGLFRGLELNACGDSIRKFEGKTPDEATAEHLFYEYDADSLTSYTVDYQMKNDSLQEIRMEVSTSDLDLGSYLFCDLKDYYAHKLPNPKEEKGSVVYNCFEGQRKPYVVSLSDNSSPTRGVISMFIYKDN